MFDAADRVARLALSEPNSRNLALWRYRLAPKYLVGSLALWRDQLAPKYIGWLFGSFGGTVGPLARFGSFKHRLAPEISFGYVSERFPLDDIICFYLLVLVRR